jgi:hypothetical protein
MQAHLHRLSGSTDSQAREQALLLAGDQRLIGGFAIQVIVLGGVPRLPLKGVQPTHE